MLRRGDELRRDLAALAGDYGALPDSGLLIDTDGVGALTTPGYCAAGAREVFDEAALELAAAAVALERAAT
ncbi:hypothetical protein [Nocardia niwae]|uniref:hypothetical protein n=1 Tax=Nocardia niwae TaxID=626084 RepID=UPI000AEF87B0|nr:hypothetical protein [Nocardia niwae]